MPPLAGAKGLLRLRLPGASGFPGIPDSRDLAGFPGCTGFRTPVSSDRVSSPDLDALSWPCVGRARGHPKNRYRAGLIYGLIMFKSEMPVCQFKQPPPSQWFKSQVEKNMLAGNRCQKVRSPPRNNSVPFQKFDCPVGRHRPCSNQPSYRPAFVSPVAPANMTLIENRAAYYS